MKKKIVYIFIAILMIIHFLALHFLGISSFTTTILFYYLIFLISKQIINFIKKEELKEVVIHNVKTILIALLFFEFVIIFLFARTNNYTAKNAGIYLSSYMRVKQICFLNKFGYLTNYKIGYENGYIANFTHQHKTSEFNYTVRYNSIGIRGKLPSIKKDSNEYRIAVIGDSFVEGYGAGKDSTFPVLLEEKLTSVQQRVSVINGGICGSNPFYEIKLYSNLLKKYNPNLVILEINDGDLFDYDVTINQGKMPVREYFYAISHTYRILDKLAENLRANYNIKQPKKTYATINNITNILANFNQQLKTNNQQLVVIYLPFWQNIFDNKKHSLSSILLNDFAIKKIPFIDMQDLYKKQMNNSSDSLFLYYWKQDGHHNSKGYNLVAEIIYLKLKELKYIEDK